jgi:DNA-binding CsgD family transcriptional regulator
VLELLIIPACFLAAGLIGFRLGTPGPVAGGLVAVGCCHLLAFLGARQALGAGPVAGGWIHLTSQLLFLAGFVAIFWLAAAYPHSLPAPPVMSAAVGLAAAGPILAALSGPTPSIIEQDVLLGPVAEWLPEWLASFSVAPLMILPAMSVVLFAVRARRAPLPDRAAMRWPIVGAGCLLIAVVAGVAAPDPAEPVVSTLFLLTAPLLPLSLAFGPVAHRIRTLTSALAESEQALAERSRPPARPEALRQLTPRELSVLEAMARGAANPVIARELHLSLSSVEKHVTSIFRKLAIEEGPAVHRRVAAVMAYRDALDADARRS